MLLEHQGKSPRIHKTAWIAPTATICGDVTIGEGTCVSFGAVIVAQGGPVVIGRECIIMENAVLRGTTRHTLTIGDNVLVGPRAALTGCTVEDCAFVATGVTIFNAARVGRGAEVRVNGVVHLRSVVAPGAVVPIGWVVVGDPGEILPPNEHDRIWAIQKPLDFPRVVFGLDRAPNETFMPKMTQRYARALRKHASDAQVSRESATS